MACEAPGDVPVIKAFLLYGLFLAASFTVVALGCYATTGGPDPSVLPMPDDGHQPIDINAMRRDR